MKVFAYTRPPLNGRHLVGCAEIPEDTDLAAWFNPSGIADGETFHITSLTLEVGDSVVTERVILLLPDQSPEALPGWQPIGIE
jgi:hypothetical protein